jgi:Cu+-exporting ATPase
MTDPSTPTPASKPPVPPQPRDPVCGMDVDVTSPPGGTFLRGRFQYAFCSDRCRERFEAEPDAFLARDPVCGMDVNPFAPRGGSHEHEGKAFHFCSMRCLERFREAPDSFLSGGPKGMESAPPPPPGAEVVWVCPMDPEVREKEPVPCPICGMALEPLVVGGMPLADERNPELENMTRRFWLSFVPALFVFNLSMADMLLPGHPVTRLFGARPLAWLQLVASAPVVLWGGWPFFQRAWLSLRTRHYNMFTLIGLGTGAAWLFSAVATVLPASWFPAAFRDHGGAVPVYFESAAVIVELVCLGQMLELRARSRVSGAIRALLRLSPKVARRAIEVILAIYESSRHGGSRVAIEC